LKTSPVIFLADVDNSRLAALCGPLDENLRQLESAYDVTIRRRGARFTVSGARGAEAVVALQHFQKHSDRPLSLEEVQLGLVELSRGSSSSRSSARTPTLSSTPSGPDAAATHSTQPVAAGDSPVLRTRRADLHGRTPMQCEYLQKILAHDITLGVGPAGTGKTYLAVACAVDALERDTVQRIVLTRPAVEAGERLGFLPGDLAQKVDPYLRPLYDALYDLLGFDRTAKLFEKQAIEVAPLAYMRGRTLNNAFIILDEAQNTTPEQMKMFLTRIGFGSKAVVTGDVTQIDLPRGQKSGLIEAQVVLRQVRGIASTQFTSRDVVRHPLVARIVDAYEAFQADEPAQTRPTASPRSAPQRATSSKAESRQEP